MTINQLRRYKTIVQSIKNDLQLLDELILKSKPFDMAGGNPYAVSDNVTKIVLEREKMRRNIESLINQKNAVEDYIMRAEPYYRGFLWQHYIQGHTWAAIAIKSNTTEESLKKSCHRYVRRNP